MKRTTLCYLKTAEGYLMLHREGSRKQQGVDENAGKWIGFGGKFLEGESDTQCLLREVYEETGLTLTRYEKRALIRFCSDLWEEEEMHLFTADGYEGALRPCDEGEIAEIKASDLLSLPMWEGDRIFLTRIRTDHPFFTLSLRYEGERLCEAILDGRRMTRCGEEWV